MSGKRLDRRFGVRYQLLAALLLLGAVACGGKEKEAHGRQAAGGDTSAMAQQGAASGTAACPGGTGGLELPSGFCASVFADSVGAARDIAVAPNGDVFINVRAPLHAGPVNGAHEMGVTHPGVLALRDTKHTGKADTSATFADAGGTGIGMYHGYVYVDEGSRIVRYPLPSGSLTPSGAGEAIVVNLPTDGHDARNFTFDSSGAMYVNVGSATNACQIKDRAAGSPGRNPCPGLKTRAGIWKFDANKPGQTQATAVHFATGIRNAMGLEVSPIDGKLYATQHGRDQLYQNWPKFFTAEQGAENPAEELVQVNEHDDFGWPYCFFSLDAKRLVLAPEYGGDGKKVGRCASKKEPIDTFPGHWAPESMLIYTGTQFPARYHGGIFIAFHGSWNRAPEPQAGYKVVFVPMQDGAPSGAYETFADGFAGPDKTPGGALHRPVGLAEGSDGSIFVTDDKGGRIWKITYGSGR